MTPAWDDTLSILIPLLAAAPFTIALIAYRRTPTTRVLLFTAAFAALFLKGLVIAAEVLFWHDNKALDALELVLEAALVLLFLFGMIKA